MTLRPAIAALILFFAATVAFFCLTAPRFATYSHRDSFNPDSDREKTVLGLGSLAVNGTVSRSTREELSRRGHKLTVSPGALGATVMLYIDPAGGMVYAAGDPSATRHAAAVPETKGQ